MKAAPNWADNGYWPVCRREKTDFSSLAAWQQQELKKQGVTVRIQTSLTKELVQAEKPDVVFIATGSKPFVPPIPGAKQEHVVLASEILAGKVNAGANVVVIGGGLCWC